MMSRKCPYKAILWNSVCCHLLCKDTLKIRHPTPSVNCGVGMTLTSGRVILNKGILLFVLMWVADSCHARTLMPKDAYLAGEFVMAAYHAKLVEQSECKRFLSIGLSVLME